MPRTVPVIRLAILGSLGVLLTVFAYVGRHDFRAQSIPLDSLYVLGTQGEEMQNYTVTLNEGSGVRVFWNMNSVSTRLGYAIYCGLRRNNSGYEAMPPQDDRTEYPNVSTTYDFECRSCKMSSQAACFTAANTDYVTTYGRTFSVKVPGSSLAASSVGGSSLAPQTFIIEGTQGEQSSGDSLTLRAGSMLRAAWNITTVNTRGPLYAIYCGLSKNGAPLIPVSGAEDRMEELPGQTTYELTCRSCRNFTDYTEQPRPDPWDVCFNRIDNTDYIETFRRKYVVDRELYCGDSKITGTERCDDGTNTTPGDGCSMSCTIEPGWTCTGAPSKCNVCGNGNLEGAETCDDANKSGGDGCSATCQTETGYSCSSTTCTYDKACRDGIDNDGDGLIDAQENRASSTYLFGDEAQIRAYLNGISALITPDPLREREFLCPNYAQISSKKDPTLPYGQVRLADEEEMKDTAADKFCRLFQWDEAITASCVGRGFNDLSGIWGTWKGEQMIREPVNFGNYAYYNAIRCAVNPDCSDGEDNDYDGNTDYPADPGCTNVKDTSELRADNGCTSLTDLTEGACGDGVKEPAEQCDDGNVKAGDGCGPTCVLEHNAAPATSTASSAGVASLPSSRSSLASPSSAAVITPSSLTSVTTLLQAPSSIQPNRCGDGMRANAEECDDGNRQNGDGCSATCLFESLPPPRSSVRSVAFAVSSAKPAPPVPAAQPPKPAAVSSVRQSAAPIPAAQTPTISSAAAVISRPSVLSSAKQSVAWVAPIPVIVSSAAGTPLPSAPFATCGNGKLEEREQCDRGPQNALTPNADCRPDCTFGRCGDGIFDPLTEECDDGNRFEGDGCSLRCLWEIRPSVSSVMYGTPLAGQPMPLLFLDPTSPPKTASSLPTLPQSQPENPPVMQPTPPTPPEHPAAPPFVMEQQSSPPSEAIPYVEPEMRMPYDETQQPAPLQETPLTSSSSSSLEPAPAEQHGFSVWHLPMLRPDIFPTLRSAEEALLFVEQNICTSSHAEVVPYLPYFRCKQVQSGFEGSLTGVAAGSASLGAIAGLLLTGIAWVRMRRAR